MFQFTRYSRGPVLKTSENKFLKTSPNFLNTFIIPNTVTWECYIDVDSDMMFCFSL